MKRFTKLTLVQTLSRKRKRGLFVASLLSVVTLGCVLFVCFSVLNVFVSDSQAEEGVVKDVLTQDKEKSVVPKTDAYRKSKLTRDESTAKADKRSLRMSTGEDSIVDLDFNANLKSEAISIGNPAVVQVQLVKIGDKNQLVFKPLSKGDTTVTIRDEAGNVALIMDVRVDPSNLLKLAGELRELLKEIEGLEIKIVGQKIILDGELVIPMDFARLLGVITDKAYSDYVLNLVTLSSLSLQLIAKKIQEDVNTFAPTVTTRVVNGVIFLEGTVDSYDAAKRAGDVAKYYMPDVKPGNPLVAKDPTAQTAPQKSFWANFITITTPPQKKQDKLVRVTVHFVELSKDYNKVFGFKWQPGFTSNPSISIGPDATGATSASGATFTATLSSLFPKLQSAQAAGYARVLKHGTVLVRNAQPASLEELTKIPYSVIGANGQVGSSSESVGLALAVTPQIMGQTSDILMQLELKQTNLVGRGPSAGSAPITSQHNVKTSLFVKSEESAAVGAVVSSDTGTDYNKDDPLPGSFSGSTDPLFSLLRSKSFRKKKSQFVIFVTPQIIENASDGTDDLKKNFRVKVE